MKRRSFLIGASTCLAVSATGAALYLDSTGSKDPRAPADKAIADFAKALKGVALLGLDYLEQQELPRDPKLLVKSLIATIPGLTEGAEVRSVDMANMIAKGISADFREGRLCSVDGWELSQTECRLAGLHVVLNDITEMERQESRSFENANEEHFIRVSKWGPKRTTYATPFNVLPNGKSSMWFVTEAPPPRSMVVYINQKPIQTWVRDRGFSADIDIDRRDKIIETIGDHDIYAYDKARHVKQKIGSFVVKED